MFVSAIAFLQIRFIEPLFTDTSVIVVLPPTANTLDSVARSVARDASPMTYAALPLTSNTLPLLDVTLLNTRLYVAWSYIGSSSIVTLLIANSCITWCRNFWESSRYSDNTINDNLIKSKTIKTIFQLKECINLFLEISKEKDNISFEHDGTSFNVTTDTFFRITDGDYNFFIVEKSNILKEFKIYIDEIEAKEKEEAEIKAKEEAEKEKQAKKEAIDKSRIHEMVAAPSDKNHSWFFSFYEL